MINHAKNFSLTATVACLALSHGVGGCSRFFSSTVVNVYILVQIK